MCVCVFFTELSIREVQIPSLKLSILSDFRVFTQRTQENAKILPKIRPWPLPSIHFSIYLHQKPKHTTLFNLLKAKRNLLYMRNQSVPRCFHHGYKNQSVNDVYSKSRCLFSDPYKTLNAERVPCRIFEC